MGVEAVEDVADDAQIGLHPQRHGPGIGHEIGRDAVVQDGKDRDAQGLRRLRRHPFRENTVDIEAEVRVLLGASHR